MLGVEISMWDVLTAFTYLSTFYQHIEADQKGIIFFFPYISSIIHRSSWLKVDEGDIFAVKWSVHNRRWISSISFYRTPSRRSYNSVFFFSCIFQKGKLSSESGHLERVAEILIGLRSRHRGIFSIFFLHIRPIRLFLSPGKKSFHISLDVSFHYFLLGFFGVHQPHLRRAHGSRNGNVSTREKK